ncbi:hypothetical protein CEUSTIGMA_g8954.t1 [Chlamydomonas eustigma]|uniref:PPM-type phosphatase domain-containing protein n=1 Tax=Chlamydomonas eustigma TaxID=1157962 RepID=A0A250XES2_9CHLO|nr:hypothetical protein CEUSTIGMA_g8954.t1 [Chlamydomonas eustigma]|eukprot:GAX81526.1 hypothetical protein CEUSTIGMA_g8954.t1 [Chlamydomonas eustigma]
MPLTDLVPRGASFELNSFEWHNSMAKYLSIGCATQCGTRYGSLNQDYCVVQEMYTPAEIPEGGKQVYIAAICDGHGILGDKAALFSGKTMIRHLYAGALRNKTLCKMNSDELALEMRVAFQKGHLAACSVYDNPPKTVIFPYKSSRGTTMIPYCLVDVSGIAVYRCPQPPCRSKGGGGSSPVEVSPATAEAAFDQRGPEKMLECGCTATVAVVQGRRLLLADVGDSAAVLGSCTSDNVVCEECNFSAEALTERHWGLNAAEAERLRTDYGHCTRILEDGYVKMLDGHLNGYELAVTRALGHKNLGSFGIISEPHIIVRDLEERHCCLVLASDGVWDVMTPMEAVQHVMSSAGQGRSAKEAAEALVQHAVQLGLSGRHAEQDNTSAAVVFL